MMFIFIVYLNDVYLFKLIYSGRFVIDFYSLRWFYYYSI